ncbi:MAG: GH32 C-terminal domain-containing protein [Muribaculaceae bacterium]
MKRISTYLSAFALLAASVTSAAAAEGIVMNHLSATNSLVRITDDAHYLLFPVQEAIDDARVNVLVDGKLEETIYVRLAKTKTDFLVPFDLTPYRGHNVVLDVVSPQSRNSVRESKSDVCWREMKLSDSFDTSNREAAYRPAFHHAPLYGWMNDPNGMFYNDGVWHLYYQYNPYGSKWQNMTWAHSSSTDLIHWKHEPIAIKPNGLGTVFSGSCAIDHNGTAGYGNNAIIALYTSAGTSQMQSLAVSNNGGLSFKNYGANTVCALESEARDPNMFWNEKIGKWNIILAHPLEHEMLIFSSPDLKQWTLESSFGKGLGEQDGVWECPDLFELSVEGETLKKWVLISNINPGGPFGGSATQYFIGDFDGKSFTPDKDANGNIPTKWMDYGKDNYATVSWSDAPDGRRTVIGWMSNWQYAPEVPTKQFRSANTLPRDMKLFRASDGEIYLASEPSPELTALRDKLTLNVKKVNATKKAIKYSLPKNGLCEILLDVDARKAAKLNLTLGNEAGDKVVMAYDPKAHTISMDRTKSGITDFSADFPAVTVAPTREASGKVALRIFIDRSSIELFGDNGHSVMTNLVFPNAPYTSLTVSAEGGKARISNFKVYSIK